MRPVRFLALLVVVLLVLWPPPSCTVPLAGASPATRNNPHQTLAIIVNRSNPIENLSFAELRKIFLGERSRWPNGHRVIVTMLDSGFPERNTILRDVYHMTESSYQDHFLKGTYTGEIAFPPKTLSSPEILRKFVFNAPGAIGYLRASDVDGSVKVVAINGRLPDSLEYKLLMEAAAK
jgi:ABC-type phosphate transport system substrate-binding protein